MKSKRTTKPKAGRRVALQPVVRLQLFSTRGDAIIVAKDERDANRVMREEWGEIFPIEKMRGKIPVTNYGGDTETLMEAETLAAQWGRGIAPEA